MSSNEINNSTRLATPPLYKEEVDKTEVSRRTQLPRDVVSRSYETDCYRDEQHLVEQSAVLELLLWHSQQRLTHIGITNSLLVTMNFWIRQDSVAMQLTYSGNLYREFSWKNLSVKNGWKSVYICLRYDHKSCLCFIETRRSVERYAPRTYVYGR